MDAPGIFTTVARDGAALEYEIVGLSGDPVVLLHGSFTGRRAFSRQRDALVEAGYRLLIPSMRGHDGSSAALPAGHGFATTEVDDLCDVLAAAGVERARFVGHSTGGTVAFALARARPGRVVALALVEPTLVGLLDERWKPQTLAAMQRAVDAGQTDGGRPAMAATMDFIGGPSWDHLDEPGRDRVLDALRPVSQLAAPHIDQLARFPVADADIVGLSPPALFLYGRDSVPFEAQIAARIAALRPDLAVRFVDGAGHNAHRDNAPAVNRAVLEFFAAVGQGPATDGPGAGG